MANSTIQSARSLIEADRLQEARQILMSVIGENPGSVEALSELATVECLEGKYDSGLDLIDIPCSRYGHLSFA